MHFVPPAPPQPTRSTRLWHTTVFRTMAVATAVLATAAILVVALAIRSTNDALSRATIADLDREGAALRQTLAREGLDALVLRIAEQIASGDGFRYRLSDAKGTRIAGNLREAPSFQSDAHGGGTFRYGVVPRGSDGASRGRLAAGRVFSLPGDLTLIVARDIEAQREFLTHTNWALGLGVGLLALVGLGAGVLLSRHLLGRVDAMTAASRSIMAGNLAERLPRTGSSDELDRLADSLNLMLDRIELLMAGLKEVSDNIAHDLKTPLNRLRNRAEAALADARGGPAWRDGLEQTIEDADELMKTFNALLLIARLEAGAVDDTLASMDLGAMVGDLAELYEPAAEEAGLSLAWQGVGDGAVEIRANRQLIGQAIANLIENAIKYGVPDGESARQSGSIMVALRTVHDRAEVIVADRGPGIPEGDRERAMRRFVRLEASRTKPGTGLGLSLVAAVARLHGGTFRLEDNQPGLRAVLSLPMIGAPAAVSRLQASAAPDRNEKECNEARTI